MPLPKPRVDPIKLLLLFSLALFSFAYGMGTVQYKVFPFKIVRDAKNALDAFVEVLVPDDVVDDWKDHVTVPTARQHAPADGSELILVSGGNAVGYLKTHHESGCLAWLMDRHGDVKHVWTYDPATWGDLKQVTMVPGKSYVAPTGLHLYKDGGLLVNFTGRESFPAAIGIARFDRDSNVLWKKELLSHHWFAVADDGRIFVPANRIRKSPIRIGHARGEIQSPTDRVLDDVVLILDQNGNILDEISILEALFESGYQGLFQDFAQRSLIVKVENPLHLNDVRLVSPEFVTAFSWLNADDLLLSMRNINSVGILDAKTRRFKWMATGVTVRQHSPRFYDGGILLFDNRGGDRTLGGTRLVHVDLETRLPRTLFPLSAEGMPDKCYSEMAGHLDVHRDGKRVLMTVCEQGVVWEVDLEHSTVLWEYIYVHPQESGKREDLETAKYVYDASFPFNRKGETK